MRTLFNPAILTHSPAPEPRHDPFEFVYALNKTKTASTPNISPSSSFSNFDQNGVLTRKQFDDRALNDEEWSKHEAKNVPSVARRKGNPKLLMMGQRRSGKTSIQSVIFQKLAPAETLYLESTNAVKAISMNSFTTFEILELPSSMSVDSPELDHKSLFKSLGAVIWVIDVQDEYLSSIAALVRTAEFLTEHYPRVHLEVLIHKTDGLSEDYRYDASREVRQRVQDEFSDVGLGHRSVAFHQTSIFDHSIFEAMSKIVQRLLLQLESLEAMLNKLCSTCGMQKAFLFDTTSKLYIATDASPTFLSDYEACSDYLDVLIDLKALYSWHRPSKQPKKEDDSVMSVREEDNLGESLVTFEKTGDTYVFAKELTEHLSLICILGKGSGVEKRVLIDYNVGILRDAVVEIFNV